MRTRPLREQRGQAGVGVAGVVGHDREVGGALLDEGVDERERHAGRAEPADEHGGAVRDVGDGLGGGVADGRHAATFSSTTASAWPTPMQIAATPQRSPRLAQPVGQGAEDPGAAGAERVADRDGAALGVDDLGVRSPSATQASTQASDCTANASLSSTAPTSAQVMPARASAWFGGLDRGEPEVLRVEGVGPAPGDPRERVDTESSALAGDEHRGGAVVER